MIKDITLFDEASYFEPVEIEPNKINYLYGGNGTGKTTFANVISDESKYSKCSLNWENSKIETIVYNKSFVENNFGQSNSIKGIFTLGKDAKNAQKFIDKAKKKKDDLQEEIDGIQRNIDRKKKEKEKLKDETIEKCWNQKRKHEEHFYPAFKGNIQKKIIFFQKCLSEQSNDSKLLELGALKNKCETIYNKELEKYSIPEEVDYNELQNIENKDILKAKIVGSPDLPISDLINELDNSDWIKEGVEYLEKSEPQCPFCQQEISQELQSKIKSFFDKKYERQLSELNSFIEKYHKFIHDKLVVLRNVYKQEIDILDYDELKYQIKIIEEKFRTNKNLLAKKLDSPSLSIELDSIIPLFKKCNSILKDMSKKIKEHNNQVDNIDEEKKKLNAKVWKYIATETKSDLKSYKKKNKNIEKAFTGLKKSKNEKIQARKKLDRQIKQKESKVTSIEHVENEINKLLTLFGFTNFKLAPAEKNGHYKLVRNDGTDAEKTLSEGEYTFITFLYFYHLLQGSTDKKGITRNKVVVIDDPISSLDNDILFVVSNLIKELISDCKEDKNGFKQIFVLTHNIYFHKEITFRGSRHNGWKEESYWIVRKLDSKTSIEAYDENPIKTSYQVLWHELDDLRDVNTATIFNTMRRILEYYFKIIGGLDYEGCINNFDGEEKIICKSLVSWINDGSHFINDDLVINVEPETVERYRDVFKSIFDEMGHLEHYKMMMRRT